MPKRRASGRSISIETGRLRGVFWRVLTPRWARDPLSGQGAAIHGGRFNEVGVAALYLSLDLPTAIEEYQQDIDFRPGTFCAYQVDVGPIADLTLDSNIRRLRVTKSDLLCDWKQIAFYENDTPPTWKIAKRLRSLCAGVMVPSARVSQSSNLVLWRWNDMRNNRVRSLDPSEELKKLDLLRKT